MRIFNEKPLSQIRAEREQRSIEPLLDVYEAIVAIGEELENVKAEKEALKAKVEALEGGVNNG
jgi:hypothetical protein